MKYLCLVYGEETRMAEVPRCRVHGLRRGAPGKRAALPEPEAIRLLALMLLQESRRAARISPAGEVVRLEDQDRSLWKREQIAEGYVLVERVLSSGRWGAYALRAAIAAVHAEARTAEATDWPQIDGR